MPECPEAVSAICDETVRILVERQLAMPRILFLKVCTLKTLDLFENCPRIEDLMIIQLASQGA